MLNRETGEMEYDTVGGYDRERIYLDKETGEVSSYPAEPTILSHRRRSKFLVPKQYLRNQSGIVARRPASATIGCAAAITNACKQKMIPMTKEEITVGYNSAAHLLYLLPLLFMTPKLFALVISFVEMILHVWAHRKTGTNGNPSVYYRSPMHVVTRNFCEICRHERLMGRVGKLQDVRMKQMQNYFRKVTRNIA
ncbi:uncharacterized protein LOC131281915 [Anopheles ziemanni]|uniref:uncharacterized protein LOC131267589 n=1 Tax=Anopheles coustani TaxID=139045 RepID=UPI002659A6F2|nr:uncharacterized protein LOC131267589 [Anopheles coustani]XP_058167262.1 uncharacterized protein LOC131281915 [Anopheles ziemanni]